MKNYHFHQALLEAMEQQSISVAKAGMVCTLPSRTSVLAAANPVGGHYDKAKTVAENLRMSGPLLSRFDLVFIIMDKADEVSLVVLMCTIKFNYILFMKELDNLLSSHVLAMQNVPGSRPSSTGSSSSRVRREDLNTSETTSHDAPLR